MRSDVTLTEDVCILPRDMFDLLSLEKVAEIFELPTANVEHFPNFTDSDNLKAFFIWEEDGLSDNRGLFISIKRNKYSEHGLDYISQTIDNLKIHGETDQEGVNVVYKNLEGFGSSGAYSDTNSTYVVELDNCVLFKVLLNSSLTTKAQDAKVKEVLYELLSSYYSFVGY